MKEAIRCYWKVFWTQWKKGDGVRAALYHLALALHCEAEHRFGKIRRERDELYTEKAYCRMDAWLERYIVQMRDSGFCVLRIISRNDTVDTTFYTLWALRPKDGFEDDYQVVMSAREIAGYELYTDRFMAIRRGQELMQERHRDARVN